MVRVKVKNALGACLVMRFLLIHPHVQSVQQTNQVSSETLARVNAMMEWKIVKGNSNNPSYVLKVHQSKMLVAGSLEAPLLILTVITLAHLMSKQFLSIDCGV